MDPMIEMIVILSCKINTESTTVITGDTYMYILVLIAPIHFVARFHNRNPIALAHSPKNMKFKKISGRNKISGLKDAFCSIKTGIKNRIP